MKTLWIVGAGVESVAVIQKAKAMGLFTVVSDGNPQAPGFAFADETCTVNTYDAKMTARCATVFNSVDPVDGVIAACVDTPVTVAAVRAALALPGLPMAAALLGQDKWAMKRYLLDNGIPTARGWPVSSAGEIRDLMWFYHIAVVVKPVDSRGARGVTRVTDPKAAEAAWATAVQYSPSQRVIAEEWLDGPQISTEGVMLPGGQFVTVGFLDRNNSRLDEFAPFIIEDGADGPTRLSAADQHAVEQVFAQAAASVVGTTPCTVKGDMVLTAHGPKVIELALRLSGGYMSTELIPRMTGVDFIGTAIKLALGDVVVANDVARLQHRGVAIRYVIPPGCTSHPERKGHAIGDGDTRADAIREAEAGVERLERITARAV